MDTLLIYLIKLHKEQLKAHKKHLENELYHNQDKNIEKIVTLELEYINSLERAMNKANKKMREL